MYIIFLRISAPKSELGPHLPGHKQWIDQGFADGVFLLVGSLQPPPGGCVIAYNLSREALEARLAQDPFVAHNLAQVEIQEVSPTKTIESLALLQT